MSDRFAGVLVTFEKDISEEGMQRVRDALSLIKGVIEVKPVLGGIEQSIAEDRAMHELRSKMFKILWPDRYKDNTDG